jgi:hypothetical protein
VLRTLLIAEDRFTLFEVLSDKLAVRLLPVTVRLVKAGVEGRVRTVEGPEVKLKVRVFPVRAVPLTKGPCANLGSTMV